MDRFDWNSQKVITEGTSKTEGQFKMTTTAHCHYQHKNDYDSVNSTDTELKLGVVVAGTDLQQVAVV